MQQVSSSSYEQSNDDTFKPARSHGRIVLIVLCILLLAGFIIVLIRYAQPTPAGVSVNSRPKSTVSTVKAVNDTSILEVSSASPLASDQHVTASTGTTESTATASQTTVTAALQPSTAKPATKVSAGNSEQQKTTGPVKKVVNDLQSSLNATGLLTGILR